MDHEKIYAGQGGLNKTIAGQTFLTGLKVNCSKKTQ